MSVGVERYRERRRRTNVDVRLVALESSGVVSHVGTSARTPCGLDGVGGAIATESSAAGTQEGTGKRRHDAVQRVDWTRRRSECGESCLPRWNRGGSSTFSVCSVCKEFVSGAFVPSSNRRSTIAKHAANIANPALGSSCFAFRPVCRLPSFCRTLVSSSDRFVSVAPLARNFRLALYRGSEACSTHSMPA